jgi:hypothetical protein
MEASVSLSSVSHPSRLTKPEGVIGILIHSQLVRSTGKTTWGLQLASLPVSLLSLSLSACVCVCVCVCVCACVHIYVCKGQSHGWSPQVVGDSHRAELN